MRAYKRLLPAEDKSGRQDDQGVGHQVTLGHRDAAPAVQDARQDVGAAAGALRPVDQAIADAADHRPVERIQHQVVGDPVLGKERQPQDSLGEEGIRQDGHQRPQGETPPAQVGASRAGKGGMLPMKTIRPIGQPV